MRHPAETPRARVVYSAALDSQGVAFWAVEWTQRIQLVTGEAVNPAIAPELYASQAPNVGPPHIDDYERIDGGVDA